MNGKVRGPGRACPTTSAPLAVWVVLVAALYFAKEVLIPLALAILISFLLAPVVNRLERLRLGRVLSVILVLLVVFSMVGAIGYLVTRQFIELASELPNYRQTIVQKVQRLRPSGEGTFFKARAAYEDLKREVSKDETTGTATSSSQKAVQTTTVTAVAAADGATTAVTKSADARNTSTTSTANPGVGGASGDPGEPPLEVKVVEGPTSPIETFMGVLGPIFSWLGTAGLVILFVLFMLLQRDDLRDRLIRLAGQNRVKVTTEALDEAGNRVSRYLLMQLIVNVTYGVPVAIGLYFIGLPNVLLWGVLATILRFIPYIGPWIAAAVPILLSVAVFDDWTHTFLTIGLYVTMELLSNNFMEPMLYGHTTGVSPVAIIISAVFWTWLWGGVGLLLATPITVCLLVIGRHVPQLTFLNVLLGDQPVLSPAARVYNRLLADDQDDALEVVEKQLDKQPLVEVYDDVLLPALGMAERDRHEGELPADKQKIIWASMSEMIDSFADRADAEEAKKDAAENPEAKSADTQTKIDLAQAHMPSLRVLCLPARDHADELAASMLAQILVRAHHTVRVVSVETLASEMVEQVKEFAPDLVIISALPPLATTHARYLCKRVKAHMPEVRVNVGLWNAEGDSTEALKRLQGSGVDTVVKSLQEAVAKL